MRRLLNVNSYHYRRGGSDAVYFEHARVFGQLGWENAYFSMKYPKNVDSEWSKYFVDELEFGFDYTFLQKMVMASKVVYSFEAQRKLEQLLGVFKPDIAHLHCIYHHLSPSILPVMRKHGIPVVMTAHDLKLACPAYKMLNAGGICEKCKDGSVLNVVKNRCIRGSLGASAIVAVESALHGVGGLLNTYYKHLSAIVAPSHFYREKLIEWGWDAKRVVYIPNFSDVPDQVSGKPGQYILYFGRLSFEKGVHTAIAAAAAAGVELVIAGTGPDDSKLKALAQELKAPVRFVGYQSGAALHQLVDDCRAVVLPSEWYENAPMTVLESFARGKTVIGATMGGITEMINEGENGWLFESGNAAALAQAYAQVMGESDSRLLEMGMGGRQLVQEKFSRSRYVEEMSRLYDGLLAAPH
ncbi:glycosyltransferase [Roseateles sp. BYS180W]|uniref:Glycosyltransferase n=1 Tax=Roseateles rivi TaxID=3299028 RepID=A0ABW7FRQ2_9BURK